MSFTSFLHKKLVDLLNARRIVVWYDVEGDFADFVRRRQPAAGSGQRAAGCSLPRLPNKEIIDAGGTETPADIIALALGDTAKAAKLDDRSGGIQELLQLFETAVGFKPASASRQWQTLRPKAAEYEDAFLAAVQAEGWPPDGGPRQTRILDDYVAPLLEHRERTAFFMADSLRYEMGRDLGEALAGTGEVAIHYAAGVVPTVTGCGMAALMPGADGMLRLVGKDGGLVPALGARLLKTSTDRMKLLAETYGDRFFETTLDELLGASKKIASKLKHVELFVVRTQDPDVIGENLGGWRARRYLSEVVGDIAAAIRWVVAQGFPSGCSDLAPTLKAGTPQRPGRP